MVNLWGLFSIHNLLSEVMHMAIKSITKNFDGYTREVLLIRVNGSKNIGNKGEINLHDIGDPRDKKQGQSNSASKSVGQGPKDKALEKLDEIADNQSIPAESKETPQRHKPAKHRRLKGDGRLPPKTGKGFFKVSAWRSK